MTQYLDTMCSFSGFIKSYVNISGIDPSIAVDEINYPEYLPPDYTQESRKLDVAAERLRRHGERDARLMVERAKELYDELFGRKRPLVVPMTVSCRNGQLSIALKTVPPEYGEQAVCFRRELERYWEFLTLDILSIHAPEDVL